MHEALVLDNRLKKTSAQDRREAQITSSLSFCFILNDGINLMYGCHLTWNLFESITRKIVKTRSPYHWWHSNYVYVVPVGLLQGYSFKFHSRCSQKVTNIFRKKKHEGFNTVMYSNLSNIRNSTITFTIEIIQCYQRGIFRAPISCLVLCVVLS